MQLQRHQARGNRQPLERKSTHSSTQLTYATHSSARQRRDKTHSQLWQSERRTAKVEPPKGVSAIVTCATVKQHQHQRWQCCCYVGMAVQSAVMYRASAVPYAQCTCGVLCCVWLGCFSSRLFHVGAGCRLSNLNALLSNSVEHVRVKAYMALCGSTRGRNERGEDGCR